MPITAGNYIFTNVGTGNTIVCDGTLFCPLNGSFADFFGISRAHSKLSEQTANSSLPLGMAQPSPSPTRLAATTLASALTPSA